MSSSKIDSLQGNLIAITGAGSGIGRSLAHVLASSGALLSLADINADAVKQVAKELTDNGFDEQNVFWRKVDVADFKEVQEWVDETVARFGRKLDGAANLAGIAGNLLPLRTYSQADFRDVFSVNVEGIFNCLAAQLPNMREANPPLNPNAAIDTPNSSASEVKSTGASIVNAGSVAGLVGKPNCSVYCASKFAVIGITKSAANEEGQRGSGIRVNAIAPAFVQTPMMEGIDKITGDPLPHGSVFGRRATPDEVAKVIRFLLSEESSYVTGSVYQIDGGMLC